MMNAAVEQDNADLILEDYRATVRELRGNVERLKELVEEQILLETPPRLRDRQSPDSQHASLASHAG
jgi:Mg-chelatase subunit ChlI